MAKTTWRFEFVDINKSITINEEEATWIGYAIIRAPKGTTQAMYVPPRNPQMIETMFGYASADWPDIYEVIDFNQQYGVYISAPTVDVTEYPNYYGGVYLTKQGLVEMYRVTDKKEPNFEVGLKIGSEHLTLPNVEASTFTVEQLNDPGKQAKIEIKNVDANIYKKLKYIDFTWGNSNVPFRYKLDKQNGELLPDASSVSDSTGQKVVCGTFQLNESTKKYDFVIGGEKEDQSNAQNDSNKSLNTSYEETFYGIPFIDFSSSSFKAESIYNYKNYMGESENSVNTWLESTPNGLPSEILNAILTGGKVTLENGAVLDYEKPFIDNFRLVYDIEDDVYSYHVQPSQTANKTTILVSDVVYDKYNYTRKLYYTSKSYSYLPTPENGSAQNFAKTITSEGYLAIASSKEDGNSNGTTNVADLRIYAYVDHEDEDTGEVTSSWKDVTGDYATEAILAFDSLDGNTDSSIHHKIFRVGTASLTEMTLDAKDEDYMLTENAFYSSYYCKATEEDSEGEIHTSGAFTGSLDEFGVDSNGTDNYWEDLIPPGDSVVYAEPYIVRTFDADLDANGIYTGYRIDGEASAIVHGQRYVDYVVEKNIKDGNTGGECTSASTTIQKKFAKIIKEGLIEAAKPKYEDCSIFFECTGIESLKTYLGAIRTSHYTATIITPKNITSIANCRTETVSGRFRGTAQYCQELQYKDKNVRKKYYSCPIGSVAAMLLRIMENYYGGIAPMWLNEGDVGGQLDDLFQRTPLKPRWDFSDNDTKIFDEKGINPIMMDKDDGVMIVSQRTTEQNAGDWSYLGHSMSFDICKREIRDNVMKPQIGKRISPHQISKRQQQVDAILAKRTSGDDPIWSYAASDIAGANNDYTRAQRIFNIPVEVRVFPYSEKVKLTFTNLSQITTVAD